MEEIEILDKLRAISRTAYSLNLESGNSRIVFKVISYRLYSSSEADSRIKGLVKPIQSSEQYRESN